MTPATIPKQLNQASARPARNDLHVARLGRISYDDALVIQRELAAARALGRVADSLLLLEHDPVYTLGRRADPSELPFPADWYARRGIELIESDRGGRVTYHGPGQLVGYPIVDTAFLDRDVPRYVATLEAAVIDALAAEGVQARTRPGLHGVWVEDRKIGSVGIRVTRGIAMHGFAVNIDCDLTPFEWVVPCGIEGVQMTSLARETGRMGGMSCFSRRMSHALAERFGMRQRLTSIARLRDRSQ